MLYIWRLATFLRSNGKVMSARELIDHLNRNGFSAERSEDFRKGGRGPYRMISETWHWVNDDLGLAKEAHIIAQAYVKADGTHVWD